MRLKSVFVFVVAILLTVKIASAQKADSSIYKTMKADIIKISDSKMTFDRYVLFTPTSKTPSNPIQYKVHAEAPATGLMSRDVFVGMVYTTFQNGIFREGKSQELAESIGEVDQEMNVVFTALGWQIQTKDNHTKKIDQVTVPWEQSQK